MNSWRYLASVPVLSVDRQHGCCLSSAYARDRLPLMQMIGCSALCLNRCPPVGGSPYHHIRILLSINFKDISAAALSRLPSVQAKPLSAQHELLLYHIQWSKYCSTWCPADISAATALFLSQCWLVHCHCTDAMLSANATDRLTGSADDSMSALLFSLSFFKIHLHVKFVKHLGYWALSPGTGRVSTISSLPLSLS